MPAFSRRKILGAAGQLLTVAWVGLDWAQLARAAEAARAAAHASPKEKFAFLTPADAADVEAIAAQIILTDDTPGAREAGVVYFVDRALATFFSRLAVPLAAQLLAFQHSCAAAHDGKAFAELPSDLQISMLTQAEDTPFFENMRMLTVFGMFSMPAYGGNREQLGWQLLGFDDQHAFAPPFGYYDRDYPEFVSDAAGMSPRRYRDAATMAGVGWMHVLVRNPASGRGAYGSLALPGAVPTRRGCANFPAAWKWAATAPRSRLNRTASPWIRN